MNKIDTGNTSVVGTRAAMEQNRPKTKSEWRAEVAKAEENMNVKRLQECHKRGRARSEIKTKSKSIIEKLKKPEYKRRSPFGRIALFHLEEGKFKNRCF